jgi:hypothetical protein
MSEFEKGYVLDITESKANEKKQEGWSKSNEEYL